MKGAPSHISHNDGLKGNKGVPGRLRCVHGWVKILKITFLSIYITTILCQGRTERQLKMGCSLLTTPLKVPNVGRPSS